MSISENIKFYRNMRKLTQQQLADKICKSINSVKKYESGYTQPPIDVLNNIARSLEISVEDLISTNQTSELVSPTLNIETSFEDFNLSKKFEESLIRKSVIDAPRLFPYNITNFGKKTISIKTFFDSISPYLKVSELMSKSNLEDLVNDDFFEDFCTYFELTDFHEAYLHSLFLYKTDDEDFKIVAFYEYLLNYKGISLWNLKDTFYNTANFFNVYLGFNIDIEYINSISSQRNVGDIIANEEMRREIINNIILSSGNYSSDIEKLSTEDIFKIYTEINESVNSALYELMKNNKKSKK